jgi:hypothetical protein
MGPRYPGQHMNPNYPGGMPPHMSSPYQRGPMRMSPNRDNECPHVHVDTIGFM